MSFADNITFKNVNTPREAAVAAWLDAWVRHRSPQSEKLMPPSPQIAAIAMLATSLIFYQLFA